MKKEIECKVIGKVQMVGFRDFVQKKARGLNLLGFAENKEDRSLWVVAQGEEDDLEKLIEHLHKGPFTARVLRVDVSWNESERKFDDFKIRY